jgi:hypothetical protein
MDFVDMVFAVFLGNLLFWLMAALLTDDEKKPRKRKTKKNP